VKHAFLSLLVGIPVTVAVVAVALGLAWLFFFTVWGLYALILALANCAFIVVSLAFGHSILKHFSPS
jgi:hypothetical protein